MTGDDQRESPILSVRDLETHYPITGGLLRREVGRVRAVDGIDFDLYPGETLGIVGESGCGKSTTARTLLTLEEATGGTIAFRGDDVNEFSREERRRYRRRIQMVFQDPVSSFDPRMTVGAAVAEPMRANGLRDRDVASERVETLFDLVGLDPATRERYPHELSGGQKQRAALARALSIDPEILVLDEPVSALDVSVQAEILALIEDLQAAFDLSILLISHDMSVVEQIADRMAVMYLGEFVERGPTASLFADPRHPYTRSLMGAIPEPDPHHRRDGPSLHGAVADPSDPPDGCRLHPRCPAVVPPDSLAVEQDVYRRIHEFHVAVANGRVGLASIRERIGGEAMGEGEERAALRAEIRAEYDLPETLADAEAESALADAIGAVAQGEPAAAAERLNERLGTVCERDSPALRERGDRDVACHRVEDRPGERPDVPVR